jgi:riboflavin kinase
VGDTVPLHPLLRIRGTVVKGFGHGSRQLGIPTANIDADSLRTVLAEAVTGGRAAQRGQRRGTARLRPRAPPG